MNDSKTPEEVAMKESMKFRSNECQRLKNSISWEHVVVERFKPENIKQRMKEYNVMYAGNKNIDKIIRLKEEMIRNKSTSITYQRIYKEYVCAVKDIVFKGRHYYDYK